MFLAEAYGESKQPALAEPLRARLTVRAQPDFARRVYAHQFRRSAFKGEFCPARQQLLCSTGLSLARPDSQTLRDNRLTTPLLQDRDATIK
jgi:hypothetical protein